jgi:hypothetical protein
MTLARLTAAAHLEAVEATERNLFLAELEKLMTIEWTTLHIDGAAWDSTPAAARYSFALEYGLDPRAAHAVAHYAPVELAPGAIVEHLPKRSVGQHVAGTDGRRVV